ncbi:hypothetical protein CCHR01_11172 [Colletotrichum chrysophilum]|uniref:Uncharacterized protein n=1 Tax=Colletotrichum chrysophilum TaxID=1836956 RepID=A0AAD9ADL6_9PEZI|nr:hypothetical protein CCHR01_11172 [Colletotrichum chrysophilum]
MSRKCREDRVFAKAFNMRGPTGRKSKYWEMGESWIDGTHSTVPVSVLNANRGARGTWVLITAVSKRAAAGCLCLIGFFGCTDITSFLRTDGLSVQLRPSFCPRPLLVIPMPVILIGVKVSLGELGI